MTKKKSEKPAPSKATKEAEPEMPLAPPSKPPVPLAEGDSVGALLRQRREELGQSLEDVSAAINVRVSQVRALEDEDMTALPGMAYALGFLRSYAAHLGLDGVETVARFKAGHREEVEEKPELNFPVPASQTLIPPPKIIWMALGGFVVLLILAALIFSGGDEGVVEIAEAPPASVDLSVAEGALPVDMLQDNMMQSLQTAIVEEEIAQKEPVTEAAPAPAPVAEERKLTAPQPVRKAKSRITLQAVQNSWVTIVDAKGKSILRKVLRPGDTFAVPDQKGLILGTGNAGGFKILVDGKEVAPVGESGDIVRGIELDPAALKSR